MKICLVCSHGGHLTEMSGSRGCLDPDSGSGTTQSTSKYPMTIKPVPTSDYERLPRLFKNVVQVFRPAQSRPKGLHYETLGVKPSA
jgi:hypothetical protein